MLKPDRQGCAWLAAQRHLSRPTLSPQRHEALGQGTNKGDPSTWLLGRPPELPQLYPDTEVALASAKIEEAEGQARLAQAAAALAGRSVNTVLAHGDVATEILERAREGWADLIVAGSRGLSAVRGLWFGSVSRKLVHYAACSVLIVKDCPA